MTEEKKSCKELTRLLESLVTTTRLNKCDSFKINLNKQYSTQCEEYDTLIRTVDRCRFLGIDIIENKTSQTVNTIELKQPGWWSTQRTKIKLLDEDE